MSTPIPKDIESGRQWQVRHDSVTGETARTGGQNQMVWLAKQRRELAPVLEYREITVGPWIAVDPDNPEPVVEEDHEADG